MDKGIVVKVVAIVRAASLLAGQVTSRIALKDGGYEIHERISSTSHITFPHPPSAPSSPSSSRIIPHNALRGVECTVFFSGISCEEGCAATM